MNPDETNQKLSRAARLQEEGKLEEARSLLLEILDLHPDDPHANYQYAGVRDELGHEREAIPFYERALENGLKGKDCEAAILGLGSSHRALGDYRKAVEVLRGGVGKFPQNRSLQVFLSMALYNSGEHREAMQLTLRALAETSEDENVSDYGRAIAFYAERLDEVWG